MFGHEVAYLLVGGLAGPMLPRQGMAGFCWCSLASLASLCGCWCSRLQPSGNLCSQAPPSLHINMCTACTANTGHASTSGEALL